MLHYRISGCRSFDTLGNPKEAEKKNILSMEEKKKNVLENG